MSIRKLLDGHRVGLVTALALFAACSHEDARQDFAPKTNATAKTGSPSLIVSAAASTKEVIESLAEKFRVSSGTDVKVNPGPSSGLASQIIADAPADLFLSASQ